MQPLDVAHVVHLVIEKAMDRYSQGAVAAVEESVSDDDATKFCFTRVRTRLSSTLHFLKHAGVQPVGL